MNALWLVSENNHKLMKAISVLWTVEQKFLKRDLEQLGFLGFDDNFVHRAQDLKFLSRHNGEDQTSSSVTTESKFQAEDILSGVEHDSSFAEPKKVDVPKYAVINTSKGSITVELYKEGSPEVVDEFIESCQKGRFKGMLFNRVIKNFVIQGGDVNRPGTTEDWTSRGKHYNQLDTSLKHEAFMLGTSKVKPDGGGFDLFITTAPIPDLTEKINVFGRVIKGEDIVQLAVNNETLMTFTLNASFYDVDFQEIEEVDTDEHYRPKAPIGITEVTLKQKL
ncbi:UNVERIFIED_CONTAM: Peptidyl-prolyl cis-trans isomerase CYP21-4 [Sesamum calycinum]|uniref:Peptidyl-prolyl cis-trans isomerase n=1 Tax=Sesamum calycinum TaxID=2727403 RepID=A0AAW2SBD4_9LAMI